MTPAPTAFERSEMGEYVLKKYSCFLCNSKSDDKGLPLMVSQTAFSRICLGQKLQEILGDRFVVLITNKDTVCWECALELNWIDKYEHKLDIAKEEIIRFVRAKYKDVEMNIKESGSGSVTSCPVPKSVNRTSSTDRESVKPEYDRTNLGNTEAKSKKFPCVQCHKAFATKAALGVHKSRCHPTSLTCKECNLVFTTKIKFNAHVAKHAVVPVKYQSDKTLSCVSCGFSTNNTETYCRHNCNSNLASLTCGTCRKRYLDTNQKSKIGKDSECPDCEKVRLGTQDPPLMEIESYPTGENGVGSSDVVSEQATDGTVDGIADVSLVVDTVPVDAPLDQVNPVETERHNESVDTVEQEGINESPNQDDICDLDLLGQEGETVISADLHTEMPEFFRDPQEKDIDVAINNTNTALHIENIGTVVEEDPDRTQEFLASANSFLKCTLCDEEFEFNQLSSHPCFIRGDAIEYAQIERKSTTPFVTIPLYTEEHHIQNESYIHSNGTDVIISQTPLQPKRRIPKIPALKNPHVIVETDSKMKCKTCQAEFNSIALLRHHWDITGHSREVSTSSNDVIERGDKHKTDKQFKVVKQNFTMRAVVMGTNEESRQKDSNFECIVKIKDTPAVKKFEQRKGEECKKCGCIFGDLETLKAHLKSDCQVCVTCGVNFRDLLLLKKHYECTGHSNKHIRKNSDGSSNYEKKEKFTCVRCGKLIETRFKLALHLQQHYRGTKKGACHYCQLEFADKSDIQQHVLVVHGAQLYKCKYCDRTFLTKIVRNRHQMKHSEHVCVDCKLKFPNERKLIVHLDEVHRPHECRICGKIITNLYSLKRHERRHFYETNFHCDLCLETFRSKSALKMHFKCHLGEAFCLCSTCGLGFKDEQSLSFHQLSHERTGYACNKCDVICPSRLHFWNHLKFHGRAHVCTVCSRTFRDTSLLAIHRRKHNRVRPYQCPHCPRVFSVSSTLRRHIFSHIKTYRFVCVLCKKGFQAQHNYHKHLDTVHAVKQPQKVFDQKLSSLSLNATDEDLLQAADTLISDDSIMFNDFHQKDMTVETVPTHEVVIETTTELFDEILN